MSEVSACCAAPVAVEGRTTRYWVCTGCGQACDAVDGAPRDAGLAVTLRAYREAAGWYAGLTAGFPPGSALPGELGALAEGSSGLVVDAGAGAGRDAAYLAGLGRRVLAVDASAPLLARAPRVPGLAVAAGDVRALPLRDGCAGAVWCSAVLLHLSPGGALEALREFRRVLAPGGTARVSVKEGTGTAYVPVPGAAGLGRHFRFWRAGELAELAERAGLETAGAWTAEEADSSGAVQRWAVVLARKPFSEIASEARA